MARVGGEEIDLTPTDGMAREAQKGLDWRKEGYDGGTAVGLARARQLVNKQELSPSTVRRMHSFFSRHEVDKQGEGFSPGEAGFPSNGRVAWALWGGDPGQTWARAKAATLDRLEGKSFDYAVDEFPEEETVKVFKLDSTIKSVDEDEDELKIFGYASTDALDRASDKILPSAWAKGGLKNYQNNPILLFNHDYNKPIGKVIMMETDSKGLKIKGVISKSAGNVYDLIKEGILSTFSVGFQIKDADYDKAADGLIVKDAELLEVSVVSVPCNQDAMFSIAKSFDSVEDYERYKSEFARKEINVSSVDSSLSGGKPVEKKIMNPDEIAAIVEKAATQTAEKLAAQAAERAAAEKTAAEKAAAEKAAAEKLEQTVISGVTSGAERLMTELETKMSAKEADIGRILDEKMSALNEVKEELTKMRDSKHLFADRRGSGDWRSEKFLAQQVEDAYILGLATRKGWNTKYAGEVVEKVNQHSGVVVSSADFEQEVSTNIERDIQLGLVLPPLFREIQLRSATQIIPIMPDSGYAEITGNQVASGSSPNGNLEARGATYGAPYGGVTLNEVTLSTVKLISQSFLGNETEEDAILPVLPLIRESIVRSHQRTVEQALLLGNHSSGVYTTGAFNGLVQIASTGSRNTQSATAFASEALTGLQLLNARQKMGKYGVNPRDVIYIVSLTEYFNLLKDPAFADWNQVQNDSTKMNGEVGMIYGSKVIVCDEFPTAGVSKHYAVAVNTRNFVVPRLRGVTLESDYETGNQRTLLVATQRIGFSEIIASATAVHSLQYKAT